MRKLHFIRNTRGENEVREVRQHLSPPSRRLLEALEQPASVRTLVKQVRLGELEKHLQELSHHGLIDVFEDDGSRETAASDTPLLEQLPVSELARGKRLSMQYLFKAMPASAPEMAFLIDSAYSQEEILIALGKAQRELFNHRGPEVVRDFFETVVAPIFFPEVI